MACMQIHTRLLYGLNCYLYNNMKNERNGIMAELYKYPRTPHLPFSKGATSDDKILSSTDCFKGKEIVITEKMDGENTTIYRNYYHARSLNSAHKEYHSYLLSAILPYVQNQIPDGWRICGEYLYAKHSIPYKNLEDYFLVFSFWNEDNECLNWGDTKEYARMLNLHLVPELYIGKYNDEIVERIAEDIVTKGGEGIVVRTTEKFLYNDFQSHVAKYVRSNHVQTDVHWSVGKVEKNYLK